MKIWETDEGLNLFIVNDYFDDTTWESKVEIDKCLKQIITFIKKFYNIRLNGFYKIKIYPNRLGLFMEMIKIDDDNYDDNETEYKVVVIFNKDLYFEYSDYSLIDNDNIFFYNNKYFINTKYLDEYIKYSDMGKLVFDDNIDFDKIIYIRK